MGLLTIGAFARATGLTPKALRLYDELGVLTPAAVDAESGYRFYAAEQATHARLIGRLREIGMPLAEIRDVCALPASDAADAIAAFWQRVSAGTAARARVTSDLVEHLSGRDNTMSDYRSAAATDPGAVRGSNEDQAYAGQRLAAVADGGGGPFGAAAATAAIDALKPLERGDDGDLLGALSDAVTAADGAVRALSPSDAPFTTLTALLRRGSRIALVHVGDARGYLLRNGSLTQLTQDHTWVRSQVDEGRLDAAAADDHPQRALLVRALGWGDGVEADLALRTARPGDRYLLCTDGLFTVVARDTLRDTLAGSATPREAVDRLIAAAREAGAPDNVGCAAYFSVA